MYFEEIDNMTDIRCRQSALGGPERGTMREGRGSEATFRANQRPDRGADTSNVALTPLAAAR